MPDVSLALNLSVAVLAAFLFGLVAQRLGLPVILGYLLAGIAIGPFSPLLRADQHDVQVLAEIGVMFLLFAVGAEFSLRELRHLGRIVVVGGVGQIVLTMSLGPLVGRVLGLSLTQGILLGAVIALSSTVVVIKVLMTRGELQALHGRIALGILILQDIAVVPMVVILPALAAGGENVVVDLLFLAGKAAAVCIGAYFIGARAAHWLLDAYCPRQVAGVADPRGGCSRSRHCLRYPVRRSLARFRRFSRRACGGGVGVSHASRGGDRTNARLICVALFRIDWDVA